MPGEYERTRLERLEVPLTRSRTNSDRGLSSRRWRSIALILLIAAAVGGGIALRLRALERAALDEFAASQPVTPISQTAHVLGSIRKLNLVTVELATHVNAEAIDESWRGDVRARVDAPVKLHFGSDLSRLRTDALRASPLGNSWIITIPPPERIATEVFGEREQTDVKVGWARFRSVAGEKQLGLARKDLYESARRLRLSDDDAQRVRAQTREQVATLVRSIVGPWASVTVKFEDEANELAAIGTPP